MKVVFTISFIFLCHILAGQTSWYVDQQNGSSSNNGKTPESALNKFDDAAASVNPGDTIFIIGEYHNKSYNPDYTYTVPDDSHLWNSENSISVSGLHGTSSAYITITAYQGFPDRPTVIRGDGANIFRVRNCSFLRIVGLEIEGEVNNIPLSTAKALQFVYIIDDGNLSGTVTNPAPSDIKHRDEEGSDPSGIYKDETYPDISNENVKRPSYTDTRGMYFSSDINNVEIINNTIHHTPGVGMKVADGRYVKIAGNEIHNCSRKSYSGTHALVVTKTRPVASGDTSVIIRNNKVHHNYNEIFSWAPGKTIITPRIDEGKGISLQKNNLDEWINGGGRILVVNNLCYWNGYSGVHSNDGHKIDFINNTCFMNSYTNSVTYAGTDNVGGNNIGISAQKGSDIKIINNISVVDTDWGGYALSAGNVASGLMVESNVIWGINGTVKQDGDITAVDVNTKNANPLFIDAPETFQDDTYTFNLGLNSASPAIGYANAAYAPATDFNRDVRDNSPDAGALEYQGTNSINDTPGNKTLTIYPNPFKDKIVAELQTPEDGNLMLFNVAGQAILSRKIVSRMSLIEIDASFLKAGIYILKFNNHTNKIIKH